MNLHFRRLMDGTLKICLPSPDLKSWMYDNDSFLNSKCEMLFNMIKYILDALLRKALVIVLFIWFNIIILFALLWNDLKASVYFSNNYIIEYFENKIELWYYEKNAYMNG